MKHHSTTIHRPGQPPYLGPTRPGFHASLGDNYRPGGLADLSDHVELPRARRDLVAVPADFGARVRAARLAAGLSHRDLVRAMGHRDHRSATDYERLGTNRRQSINRETLQQLCTLLGLAWPGVSQ